MQFKFAVLIISEAAHLFMLSSYLFFFFGICTSVFLFVGLFIMIFLGPPSVLGSLALCGMNCKYVLNDNIKEKK